jgi:hypothetical protein
MKCTDLRWFLLGYSILLAIAMTLRSDEMIGVTAEWSNGDYSFRAGSAPWAIALLLSA